MKKDKLWIRIVILISIILLINLGTYSFYLKPKFTNLREKKEEYNKKEDKIKQLENKNKMLIRLSKENENLQGNNALLNRLTADSVDTATLAYDFYRSCKNFNIFGDVVEFELLTKDKISKKNSEKSKNQFVTNDIIRLNIKLKVRGHRENIEEYIKNIKLITKRDLSVEKIKLYCEQKDEKVDEIEEYILNGENKKNIDKDIKDNDKDIKDNDKDIKDNDKDIKDNDKDIKDNKKYISVFKIREEETVYDIDDDVNAEITFYHYIKNSHNVQEYYKKNYHFFNKGIGFSSIGEMFKNKNGGN
ncbi:hypothetical protein [Clostridium rectalis]|uniref:hypothetical protein n=1 Tax=Clostridium rectalis TaxID=2040295 RepID=UPI000F62E517|nr:hypothetical protein [Clostridium rectalis]